MAAEGHADGTVGKALDVLDMVASHGRPVRFSDLLTQSAYPKATLYRLLQTLTHQGMLTLDPDTGTYALGVRLVRLAHAAWAQSSLAPIARPYLDELAAKTGETIHLAQMDQGQVLYVDKRNAAKPVEMFAQADCGSQDEVLLWRDYDATLSVVHGTNDYIHSGGNNGATKSFIDAFLMKNGLPIYDAASGYQGDVAPRLIRYRAHPPK